MKNYTQLKNYNIKKELKSKNLKIKKPIYENI